MGYYHAPYLVLLQNGNQQQGPNVMSLQGFYQAGVQLYVVSQNVFYGAYSALAVVVYAMGLKAGFSIGFG